MCAEFRSVVVAVLLSAAVADAYRLTISPESDITVDLGSTITLSCFAYRESFWLASDSVVWKKQQESEPAVPITSNSPTYSALQPFAQRYSATISQTAATTVTYKLTIRDFRHEDCGTYTCSLVGENADEATPQQVILYSGLTANVNLTSTASREDDAYVYSFTHLSQTTTCQGFFYGFGSPQVQINYGGNEITNDFQQSSMTYLEGEVVGLKKRVQLLTYNASTHFYPSSECSSPLLCKALNDREVVLSTSSISVRSQKKPTLVCNKQDPQVAKPNDTDVRIMCSLEGYAWDEDTSAVVWTFTVLIDGQPKNVTLKNGQSGYYRQALNQPNAPQLNIDGITKDAVAFTDYTIALTYKEFTVVSTTYKLQIESSSPKGPLTASASHSAGVTFCVAFFGVLASITF